MSQANQLHDPLTPEQARAQVVAAARDVVAVLGIPAIQAWVGLESCNDQGEAPFRGAAAVHYPLAATTQAAQQDADVLLAQLRAVGWAANPNFHSNAASAEKDGVTVIFEAQGAGDTVRVVTLLGQCRDITTTNLTRGGMDPFPLPRQ